MRKLKITLIAGFLIGAGLLFSCGPDEDIRMSEVLVGQWNLEWVEVDGVRASVDTTGYRLTFNVDNQGRPTTYRLVAPAAAPRPNYNSPASKTSGTWAMNDNETQIIFDPETDEASVVLMEDFIIEVDRIYYPLSWVNISSGERYTLMMVRFEVL